MSGRPARIASTTARAAPAGPLPSRSARPMSARSRLGPPGRRPSTCTAMVMGTSACSAAPWRRRKRLPSEMRLSGREVEDGHTRGRGRRGLGGRGVADEQRRAADRRLDLGPVLGALALQAVARGARAHELVDAGARRRQEEEREALGARQRELEEQRVDVPGSSRENDTTTCGSAGSSFLSATSGPAPDVGPPTTRRVRPVAHPRQVPAEPRVRHDERVEIERLPLAVDVEIRRRRRCAGTAATRRRRPAGPGARPRDWSRARRRHAPRRRAAARRATTSAPRARCACRARGWRATTARA